VAGSACGKDRHDGRRWTVLTLPASEQSTFLLQCDFLQHVTHDQSKFKTIRTSSLQMARKNFGTIWKNVVANKAVRKKMC